jgi:hypothetical protein
MPPVTGPVTGNALAWVQRVDELTDRLDITLMALNDFEAFSTT